MLFGTLPTTPTVPLTPFHIDISDSAIAELKSLLKSAHVGPATPLNTSGDHAFGVSLKWLRAAKSAWEASYDWRAEELRLNSFPQFVAKIPLKTKDTEFTYDVHFAAMFSKKVDAVPLLLLHGWPGSFIEFIPFLEALSEKYTPDTLPYHIVVGSLPGYGFSSGPQSAEFNLIDVAAIFNDLMGGDIGSIVCRLLSANHDNCKAIHLNYFGAGPPENDDRSALSQVERDGLERYAAFQKTGWAYGLEHGTRPNTIGFVLSSNPLALLVWIAEKMLEWSDTDPSMDTILTNVSIYWFTNSISTSLYSYRETINRPPGYYKHLDKPLGYTFAPREIFPVPESWITPHANLVFYRQAEAGGHFFALEQPQTFLEHIGDFIAQVWPKESLSL